MIIAESGPIVVFNVFSLRSDAIIVRKDGITSLHLPLLSQPSLEEHTRSFLESIQHRMNTVPKMDSVLRWLWDTAVEPILDDLSLTEASSKVTNWPRVWWVGSGLLNLLPIHAAGYHNETSGKTIIDRAISSYTPTVKALAYARDRARKLVASTKPRCCSSACRKRTASDCRATSKVVIFRGKSNSKPK